MRLLNNVPMNTVSNPAEFLGTQCKIPVPLEVVQEMRSLVTEETGPREHWISDNFRKIADDTHMEIGSPALTLENSWEVSTAMSDIIHTLH